jgi:hypothetical protein
VISRVWYLASGVQSLCVDIIWLTLAVLFELIFGRYTAGHSWSKLVYDYNILAGRIWGLLLMWVAAAPYVLYRLQQ